jgi:hypothetical protein
MRLGRKQKIVRWNAAIGAQLNEARHHEATKQVLTPELPISISNC